MSSALALPAELSIYTVGETRAAWLGSLAAAVLSDAEPCVVDAHAVDQMDSAGVQLLLSLDATLTHRGGSLQLQAPSAAVLNACASLGLAAWAARHITTGV